jgi:MFS family permease
MRHRVLILLVLAAVIAYVQRNAISVPTKTIQAELGFNEASMGFVMSAWFWGYAIAQLPAGWLADRWGSRATLIVLSSVWSLFTATMYFAAGFTGILSLWLGMGLAQAGVFPAATKAIGAWFPGSERASASGWLIFGQSLGGAIAPALVALMLTVTVWQVTFIWVAIPGLLWAFAYFAIVPNRAEPVANDIPWAEALGKMLHSPSMILLCSQQFFRSAAMTFFWTWFPRFLQETRGVAQDQSGYLAAVPGIAAMLGAISGGYSSDWLLRATGNRRLARQGVAVLGMMLCSALTVTAFFIADPLTAVLCIAVGAFWGVFGGVSGYSVAIEFGGKSVATVFATMNMCGNVGSALFPALVGLYVSQGGDWNTVLLFFAVLFAIDALLWALLNPKRPLFEDNYDAR